MSERFPAETTGVLLDPFATTVEIYLPDGRRGFKSFEWLRDAMLFAVGYAEAVYDSKQRVQIAYLTGKRGEVSHIPLQKLVYDSKDNPETDPEYKWPLAAFKEGLFG